MKNYESVIIVNPDYTEEKVKEVIDKVTGLINKNGKVESVENKGKKRLGYEIKKHKEGIYVVYEFSAEPDSIEEIQRNYRIMIDDILKSIVIKKED